mgnify:CR=1 FL=1
MSKTHEIWLGMQANEEKAQADCGCTLYRCDDESDDPFYVQCPLHAQAEAMREGLAQAAAGFAVIANHAGATHPGCADQDNLASVRGFALECFHQARAAVALAKGE